MKATPSFFHTFVRAFQSSCTFAVIILGLVFTSAPSARASGVVSTCDETHLRAALTGGGVVTFSCSGTITVTQANGGTITIAKDTTIDGSGQNVTISGGNAVRVFFVSAGVTLDLRKLTIANGNNASVNGLGGGIYNAGSLFVTNSSFSDNGAAQGGGIYNVGTLTVTNSTFSGNSAAGGGGAIVNVGTLVPSPAITPRSAASISSRER